MAGGHAFRPSGTALRSIMKMSWRGLLTFLEIIGLRDARPGDYPTRLSELKLRYFRFRDLLSANTELLGVVSEMELRLHGQGTVSLGWVRSQALLALTSAHRMVTALNAISGGRYRVLDEVFTRIKRNVSGSLGAVQTADAWVVPLERIDRSNAALVGSKMATLGEIRNQVGLPVPEAFATTVSATQMLLDAAGVGATLESADADRDAALTEPAAAAARRRILETALPDRFAGALREAWQRLSSSEGPVRVAVRSSAVEEDTEASFAGQYLTLLNVDLEGLADAYRQVVASAYEPEAVFYRDSMGIADADAAMAVGCVRMVDAAASGIAFSVDPVGRDADSVIIHAVWGLGLAVVGGEADPDVYVVARKDLAIRAELRVKARRLRPDAGRGVVEEDVPAEQQLGACLENSEVETLARWVLALENHFGCPQDVEWALDQQRRLWVLQSRPAAAVAGRAREEESSVDPGDFLVEGGATACPGAAAGPVVRVTPDDDLRAFPVGGVLVARQSNPRLVRAMKRACAIVTDVGSAIGHMASLSREFRVPTIVGMREATGRLVPGDVVTVDATRCRVYAGRVDVVLASQPAVEVRRPTGLAYRTLERVAAHIVPLSLTDPRDDAFTPLSCSSLHDLARYIHERSFRELFGISAFVGDLRSETPVLDVFLPIDLYVIDLGGGLTIQPGVRKVRRNEIASAPFAALVDGMLHPAIPRYGPRALDAKGFFQVVMQQALSPEEDGTLRDPCFAIVSSTYVNLSARVGFHFSAVDAYCTEQQTENYIAFRFKGGAADVGRRMRRVEAIARILRHFGFATEVVNDLVTAQFIKHEREDTLRTLEIVGRLLQYMRQMDAAMASDQVADRVVDAFISGRYGLDVQTRG